MGVRTAVLLAAVFIGAVALYLATRNRWDWPRLMKRVSLGLLLAVAVVGAWIYWSSLPPTTAASEFWGIPLGASKSDVRFLKGEPAEIGESGAWAYAPDRSRTYHLEFGESDRVTRILVVSKPGFGNGADLFGIRTGFASERLVDRLGEPSRILPLSNDLQRAYLYAHLNAVFILERGEVVSYGIYDVGGGEPFVDGDGDVGLTSSR